ncbi:MAG: PilZ domain-containing protein [Gammaproteobacteria bacterium]|nr:PilZ domain-containing protein [Gammaproteobacteria bacterium]
MSGNDPHSQQAEDRRSYFRIDDTVRLSVRRVPPDELDSRFEQLDHDLAGNFTVMSSLAAITGQMTIGLRRIENRDPDLAAYLRAIDQKIEVIGRAFITQEPEFHAEHAVPANLSAGGMCVGVDENYAAGTPLEIRMLLFPSFTGLMIYGTVVETVATPQDGDPHRFKYQSRIEFTHIRESDRELLIRHLLRRQSQQLRTQFDEDSA